MAPPESIKIWVFHPPKSLAGAEGLPPKLEKNNFVLKWFLDDFNPVWYDPSIMNLWGLRIFLYKITFFGVYWKNGEMALWL